jgi:TolB-like protein
MQVTDRTGTSPKLSSNLGRQSGLPFLEWCSSPSSSRPALNTEPETLLSTDAATALQLRPSLVAVLPFTPAGDDAGLRLLGGEIADLLRERLAHDPAVQAILISSDFLAKAPPHALELICRELRIRYLVSGRCHGGAGGPPSLYVELTDTREWCVHWAQFFRGTAHALLAPGSHAMEAMVAELRRVLLDPPQH